MRCNEQLLDIERAREALTYIDAGCSREDWIRAGMAMKATGLSFEDFHNWSKEAGNYTSAKDCLTAWKSFNETGGITASTLFHLARNNGWNPKQINKKDINSGSAIHNKSLNASVYDVWERCLPALSSHEYILRKQGKPDGLRYYPETEPSFFITGKDVRGYLVVPCWQDNDIQTLQFIPPKEGEPKLNLKDASFNDGFFLVGKINDTANFIYLVEGIGQAWAINKASGAPAIVCFGAGRIKRITKVFREKYPNACLIIVPDRGKEEQAAKIAAELLCQWVELPQDLKDNDDANDYALMYGYDKLAHLLTRTKTPEMRYKLQLGTDLLNAPPMRWLVQGIIPAEGLAALYGASGSGKSFLILDMAFSISSGSGRWFGLKVTKAPVTYVCLEGESGIGKRIKAWNTYYHESIPNDLKFVTQPFNLLSSDISELANAIISSGGKNGLVIIDTLNRAASGADENSSVDMGKIIAAAKTLQSLTGGVVLLIHHKGKDQTKGLRGHSSLYAALDGAIEVIKTDIRREWSIGKSKDDVTGNSYPFKLEIVKVGIDDEQNEITSCVAVFDSSKDFLPKKISLGRNQKIALEVIDKQLANAPHFNKEGVLPSKPCLKCEEAIFIVSEHLLADLKHRKSRAREAINGLIERRYLDMKGEWLWRI